MLILSILLCCVPSFFVVRCISSPIYLKLVHPTRLIVVLYLVCNVSHTWTCKWGWKLYVSCHLIGLAHCVMFGRKLSRIAVVICANAVLKRATNVRHRYGRSNNTYRDEPTWVLVRFHPPQPAVETDNIARGSRGITVPFSGDDNRKFPTILEIRCFHWQMDEYV